MYFPDLGTRTQIASGAHVRAVGWLDAVHPFPAGELPAEAVDRIGAFAARWGESVDDLGWGVFAGSHRCELCSAAVASGNFGVPAGDILFVCPEMIVHYVTAHRYLPPGEFVDAILAASLPGSEDYASAVARFRPGRLVVRESFRLRHRPGIYLAGRIEDGTVRPGMAACVRGADGRTRMVPVVAVEFVDGPGRQSAVALGFAVEGPEEEAAIEGLPAGSVVRLVDEGD